MEKQNGKHGPNCQLITSYVSIWGEKIGTVSDGVRTEGWGESFSSEKTLWPLFPMTTTVKKSDLPLLRCAKEYQLPGPEVRRRERPEEQGTETHLKRQGEWDGGGSKE
ncbi:hypothetical protein AOLI_G00250140 [Acnodon oligacanthus]